MTPYCNTRYTDHDFEGIDEAQMGRNEKFNRAHSQIRVVVEHAFGAVKGKWKILKDVPYYDLDMQKKVILACFGLHNFLWHWDHCGDAPGSYNYHMSTWAKQQKKTDIAKLRDLICK
jgi:hypothetical protein